MLFLSSLVSTSIALVVFNPPPAFSQDHRLVGPEAPTKLRYEDGKILYEGVVFDEWSDFQAHQRRTGVKLSCSIPNGGHGRLPGDGEHRFRVGGNWGDCRGNETNPLQIYAPESGPLLYVDIVFHVIRTPEGLGQVQIGDLMYAVDRLNEDFSAIPNTLGENGIDSGIRFRIAQSNPEGNPDFGVRYHQNGDWFADPGPAVDQPEYTEVAWDPNRFLNIYTNDADGSLGYATIPQYALSPDVGSQGDRIVIRWDTLGDDPPIDPPYHLNRTLTHEVGHWCGLWHVFGNVGEPGTLCDADCLQNGDTICDTAPQATPTWGCEAGNDCNEVHSFRNYMSYADDGCQTNFTLQQIRRMRCTLLYWRPLAYQEVEKIVCNESCPADLNLDGMVNGNDLGLFMSAWGSSVPDGACADLDGNGAVNGTDLGLFIAQWGECRVCEEGWSEDCLGYCFPDWIINSWNGDGFCDDGDWIPADQGCDECPPATPIHLNCLEHDFDGGDCADP